MHQFRTSNNTKSILETKGRNSIFLGDWRIKRELPCIVYFDYVFLLNVFLNKTKISIHFYGIHILNNILTWLMREYMYLWHHLLEIDVGTRDTAADEMVAKKMALKTHS
jgi:hypothetical protein